MRLTPNAEKVAAEILEAFQSDAVPKAEDYAPRCPTCGHQHRLRVLSVHAQDDGRAYVRQYDLSGVC